MSEWEGHIGASRTVFNGSDHSLDFRNVFIGAAGVEKRESGPKTFEFLVAENAGDSKPSVLVQLCHFAERAFDGRRLPVIEISDCNKPEIAGNCDKERNFVDKHDVHCKRHVLMALQHVRWNRVHASTNMR